jgi:ribose 5-phosphate isomerase RpiB
MAATGWDIDGIVREVLRRLEAQQASVDVSVDSPPEPASPKKNELRLTNRVVTLALLENRLAGIRRVVVPRGAVITPAVKDLLRRTNVALDRDASAAPGDPSGSTSLVAVVAATNHDTTAVLAPWALDAKRCDCLRAAVAELAGCVVGEPGKLGVLITEQSAAALCLANRQPGVRAAIGTSPEMVKQAVRDVGANVLVLDPAGRGLVQLRGLVQAFVDGGPRECPPEYREVLC